MATPVRTFNLRLTEPIYEFMRRHAFERNVSMNVLMTDILRLWVNAATDPQDPIFSPRSLGFGVPELPTEKYPGYRDSLYFVVEPNA